MEIRPTFWGVLAILVASVVGLIITGSVAGGVFVRLIFLCVLLLVTAYVWSVLSVRAIIVHRSARGLRQQMGQIFEERFEIVNEASWVRPWLAVEDGSDLPGSGGSRILSWIGSRALRNYSAYTLLVQRGLFLLGPTIIYSGDPFGLFKYRLTFKNRQYLLVLPMIIDLQYFPFPPGMLPGGRAKRQRTPDITPHAASIREYAPGDSLNRIHWPTSVRRDRLMVKEFEEDPRADVWVFLDAQKSVNANLSYSRIPPKVDQFWLWQRKVEVSLPPDTFEYGVSVAASVSSYFTRQGQSVGFACAGQQVINLPPERGERQLGKILETLSFLESSGKLPLYGLVQGLFTQLPRGSTVVLITSSTDGGIVGAVDALGYRDMRPVVVLIDPETFGGHSSIGPVYQGLQVRKVPVTRIACGDNLRRALENGFVRL